MKNRPLSLNQHHNRLLQDLNPPPPLPPPEGANHSKVRLQGCRRLCKASSSSSGADDDVPRFSGIADFDSPSPVEMKPSKAELERYKHSRRDDDDDDDAPNFSGITDDQSPLPAEKPPNVSTEDGVSSRDYNNAEDTAPIGDFRNSDKVKPLKVKVEGRRRLCKISTKVDNEHGDGKNRAANDGLKFSGISDFDSPPTAKDVIESSSCGGNEIRDILNDLSSRLEILSIEKRRCPKTVDLIHSSANTSEVNNQQKNVEWPEYTSAASSFSFSSDSLSDATSQSRGGRGFDTLVNNEENEPDLQIESESDNFVGGFNRAQNDGKGRKKNEGKTVGGNLVSMGSYFGPNIVALEDDNDDADCVVLSGKRNVKEVEKQHGKFKQESDDSDDVDAVDDYEGDFGSEDQHSITLSGPNSTYQLPGKIAKMLYPHQCDGLKWLWSLHCQGKGGILGDDMGLGKTMQICGFLAGLFHSSLIKRALVVAPKTLLPHWIKELSAVGLSERTREYFGACAKARQYELQYILQDKGVLLTTYDIVRNNAKSLRGDYYFHNERSEDDITWDYMILDEGHLIKNPSTQRAKSLFEIPCAHRIIISGTPLQNNLKELWALFNFCCPKLLGDKDWFKQKYEFGILRGNEKNASDREKRIGSTVAKELRERIQPYFLRRMKNEVFREDDVTNTAKLSKKNEIIVWLKLTSCQQQLYEAFLKSELVLSAFDGSPLAALTILKKICDHPLLLTKRAAEDVLEGMDSMLNQEDHGVAEKLAMHIADVTDQLDFVQEHDVSCKISFILSLLDKLIQEGHNVLIFSQTRKMLNLIQESLVSKSYKFLRIDGTTKASDRVKIVNDFQEGNGAPIFLLTSQVGGLGLTLTKADRVIVVDPAWNPSTDNQSVDRAYRIGQQKDVLVYRLMSCGTVEEKIYRKQIFKGGLFKSATEHKEQIRYFSQQDLRELFSLPKQGFNISLTQQQLHEEHDRQHTMDDFLKDHIKFLETLGIAGVSHHSLLFSKTAPVPVVQEEGVTRVKGSSFTGNSSSTSPLERDVDGAKYAFNPKDVKLHAKSSSPKSASTPTEMEIKERIGRLSKIFANKATVSKLPDKGERIQNQIAELNLELDKIRMAERTEKETIHLDDISGELQRVLNLSK